MRTPEPTYWGDWPGYAMQPWAGHSYAETAERQMTPGPLSREPDPTDSPALARVRVQAAAADARFAARYPLLFTVTPPAARAEG